MVLSTMNKLCWNVGLFSVLCLFLTADGTYRYYFGYLPYGTCNSSGGVSGEAMVGIQDFSNDFQRVQAVWCKFMFSHKPPANGLYPYYPSCVVRNFTDTFFCFNAKNAKESVNTFVTAVWDNEFNFFVSRPGGGFGNANGDDLQPYKCCKTPAGYYIDYVSCYYVPTHDMFYEFYDSLQQIIVQCATGYVMTGISKKKNPYNQEYHVEWIQCCRVGYGVPTVASPPVAYGAKGMPAYIAQRTIESPQVPDSYIEQYRRSRSKVTEENGTFVDFEKFHDHNSMRFKNERVPVSLGQQMSEKAFGGGNAYGAHDIRIRSSF